MKEFQTHDRLILVDRRGEGQAKTGFGREWLCNPNAVSPDSLELIGCKSELILKDYIPQSAHGQANSMRWILILSLDGGVFWPCLMSAAQFSGVVRAADQLIPGATVTARNGGAKVLAFTDENGHYTLDLTPGTWEIEISMFEFAPATGKVTVGDTSVTRDWVLNMPKLAERGACRRRPRRPQSTAAAEDRDTRCARQRAGRCRTGAGRRMRTAAFAGAAGPTDTSAGRGGRARRAGSAAAGISERGGACDAGRPSRRPPIRNCRLPTWARKTKMRCRSTAA